MPNIGLHRTARSARTVRPALGEIAPQPHQVGDKRALEEKRVRIRRHGRLSVTRLRQDSGRHASGWQLTQAVCGEAQYNLYQKREGIPT